MGELIKLVYPENFNINNIYISKDCEYDLKDLLKGSGIDNKFISQFRQRLKFLESYGRNCIKKTDWFEKLKNANDMYSMRFKLPKNIRIIFTIQCDEISILLCSFDEKSDKVKGKNSYTQNIEIAMLRLKDLR